MICLVKTPAMEEVLPTLNYAPINNYGLSKKIKVNVNSIMKSKTTIPAGAGMVECMCVRASSLTQIAHLKQS